VAHSADRNLLFGVLALQMDFITRDALIAAMNAWVLQKQRSLGEILEAQGALAPGDRALLEPLVSRHIAQHRDDPSRSLASLSSVDWIRGALEPVARLDRELEQTLDRLPSPRARVAGEAEATATQVLAAGAAGAAGPRFRILRFHAKGGLGEVFVAQDVELHREVALKQIQPRHCGHPESRSRFLLEAEITGGLEHPGIVPVYGLGHYEDGRPFYAMRFIKGDSLKEAIEQFHRGASPGRSPGERSLELQKLLRRFLDVCNAIAYAHSRGVLHRDIKPGNIMVGQYGETLLVDWGLAKVVGTTETSSEATLRPPSASGSSETLPGSAIGTPAFMSPEQAAGRLDLLGPASDVYSLGATLYCLLTGKAPIEGSNVEDVLGRVQRGEFPHPRQVQPDVPRPLEAICLQAMARNPEARYPTPRALAEDLERWLADEPVAAWPEPPAVRAGRWMRRHRTLATAAAATLAVGLVALGVAYSRESKISARLARTNRALDESNRQVTATNQRLEVKNLELVAANDLVTRAKAESDRRLDQTLQAIEDYYTGVGQEFLLGQQEFQDLRRRLVERPRQFYQQLAQELESTAAADERAQSLLAKGRLSLGKIAALLDTKDDARVQFEAAVQSYRALVASQPERPEWQGQLAESLRNLGGARASGGDLQAATDCFRQAIAVGTRLIATHPQTPTYRSTLAWSHHNYGAVLYSVGDLAGSAAAQRQAIAIWLALLKSRPDDAKALHGLATSHLGLAMTLSKLGDHGGAVESLRRAVASESRLTEAQPNSLESLHTLASAYSNLGIAQKEAGELRDAVGSHQEAIAISTRLVAAHPNVPLLRDRLAKSFNNLAIVQQATGDLAGGLASHRQAIAIYAKLSAEQPDRPDYQLGEGWSYTNLGRLQTEMGDPAGARDSHERAIAIWSRLAKDHPDVPDHQDGLASSYVNLGYTQHVQGDLARAMEAYRKASALFSQLAAARPNVPEYQHRLSRVGFNMAIIQTASGDLKGAVERYRQAIAAQTRLLSANPHTPEYQSGIAVSLNNLGDVLNQLGEYRESERVFRQAIEHQRMALDRSPQAIDFRRALSKHYFGLAETLRFQGQVKEAAQVIRIRRGLWAENATELYNAACELSLCVPIARRPGEAHELAAEAVNALRAAIAAGWNDAAKTSRDPDLAPLHGRDDFRRLLGELFDRSFPADPFAE